MQWHTGTKQGRKLTDLKVKKGYSWEHRCHFPWQWHRVDTDDVGDPVGLKEDYVRRGLKATQVQVTLNLKW